MAASVAEEVDGLLDSQGFRPSGAYRPAELQHDGRYSVDPTTLLLLLANYRDRGRGE